MRYHIHPTTGEPGVCRATAKCPFGLALADHHPSREAAREAYEASMTLPAGGEARTFPHTMLLAPEVETLLRDLQAMGARPYVVGGAVRDSFATGAEPKDIDIEAYELPLEELKKRLRQKGYRADEVGASFGVLKLTLPGGWDIDLSLPRKDSKTGEGHRGFDVVTDPHLDQREAAGRRDFTFNALYYDHGKREIIDAFGGAKHLREQELHHINEHFGEDPLRVLRAAQFAARFNLTLAPKTAELARSMRHEFPTIARERVQEEFEKLFTKGRSLYSGLEALKASGWDEPLGLTSVDTQKGGRAAGYARATAQEHGLTPAPLMAAALLRQVPEAQREEVAGRMLVGAAAQQKALALTRAQEPTSPDERGLREWSRALKKKRLTVAEYLAVHPEHKPLFPVAKQAGVLTSAPADLVTGKLVLEHTTQKPGAWMGKLIAQANAAQDAGLISTQEEARAWVATQKQAGVFA